MTSETDKVTIGLVLMTFRVKVHGFIQVTDLQYHLMLHGIHQVMVLEGQVLTAYYLTITLRLENGQIIPAPERSIPFVSWKYKTRGYQ